jgi:hypothetical protein
MGYLGRIVSIPTSEAIRGIRYQISANVAAITGRREWQAKLAATGD